MRHVERNIRVANAQAEGVGPVPQGIGGGQAGGNGPNGPAKGARQAVDLDIHIKQARLPAHVLGFAIESELLGELPVIRSGRKLDDRRWRAIAIFQVILIHIQVIGDGDQADGIEIPVEFCRVGAHIAMQKTTGVRVVSKRPGRI